MFQFCQSQKSHITISSLGETQDEAKASTGHDLPLVYPPPMTVWFSSH